MTSESLKHTHESVENQLNESIATRKKILEKMKGIGPPDLCHIIKENQRKKETIKLGFYHHVIGLDTSSVSSVASYFGRLIQSQEEARNTKSAGTYTFLSGTYLSHNSFRKMDLVVEFNLPGNFTTYFVTGNGDKVEETEQLWAETQVSSFLRFINVEYPFAQFPCLHILDDFCSLLTEKTTLFSVEKLFWNGKLLGTPFWRMLPSHANNYLVVLLKKYFFQNKRYSEAIQFFKRFVKQEPELAIYISRAYFKLNNIEKGVSHLEGYLKNEHPTSLLLIEFINPKYKKILTMDSLKKFKLIQKVENLTPFFDDACFGLSRFYLAEKNLHRVLVSLNSVSLKIDDEREQSDNDDDYMIHDSKKNVKNQNNPNNQWVEFNSSHTNANNPYVHKEIIYMDQDHEKNSDDVVSYFPKASRITVPSESQFYVDESPHILHSPPEQSLTFKFQVNKNELHILNRAYDILVDLLNSEGWEELMKLRIDVFQMNIRDSPTKSSLHNHNHNHNHSRPHAHGPSANDRHNPYCFGEEIDHYSESNSENELEKIFNQNRNKESEPHLDSNYEMNISGNAIIFNKFDYDQGFIAGDESSEMKKEKTELANINKPFITEIKIHPKGDTPVNLVTSKTENLEYKSWFDSLIQHLYSDVSSMFKYSTEKGSLRASSLVKSQAEWKRIGAIANRIKRYLDSEIAFLLAIRKSEDILSLSTWDIWNSLIDLYHKSGVHIESLFIVNQMLFFSDSKLLNNQQFFEFLAKTQRIVFRLIFKKGVRVVQEFLKKMNQPDAYLTVFNSSGENYEILKDLFSQKKIIKNSKKKSKKKQSENSVIHKTLLALIDRAKLFKVEGFNR